MQGRLFNSDAFLERPIPIRFRIMGKPGLAHARAILDAVNPDEELWARIQRLSDAEFYTNLQGEKGF